MTETLVGTCHCGRVKIRIPWTGRFDRPRRCDCSFCRRRWAVVASVKLGDLEVLEGKDWLTLYQWGTNTAEHYFCKHCGIYTHHRRRSDPTEYSVNIANFPGVDVRRYDDAAYGDGINHSSDRQTLASADPTA